ncbi:MAG TPA: FtsW/RodA/SpoVE family cell cycle protein [Bacteroidales bacterium]|nr:FtsW/RodA/SpoVE family cell cycle protein [Bacteroidales bacterium]
MSQLNKIRLTFEGDRAIWIILLFLSLLSMLAIYSSTGNIAFRQLEGNTEFFLMRRVLILFVSWFAAFIIHKLPVKFIRIFAVVALVVTIPFLFVNLIIGSRWATVPFVGISIQFSEISKIMLLVTTAWLLTYFKYRLGEWRIFLILILPASVVSLLIFFGDFSTAALIFFANTVLLFMGRVKKKHLFGMGVVISLLLVGLYFLINTYPEFGRFGTWKTRIESYTNPKTEGLDGNYQIEQSKIAIATGGLFGKLPGKSTQRYFLPEAHNDFIFAIIIEEYGSIIGGLLLVLLYIIFLYRSIAIFMKSERTFNRLVVLGIGFTLTLQAMINMGVSVGLLPVTGQTLPGISQGGTSVLMTFISIGIIQAVTSEEERLKKQREEEEHEQE